jgi:hypothetical protein
MTDLMLWKFGYFRYGRPNESESFLIGLSWTHVSVILEFKAVGM